MPSTTRAVFIRYDTFFVMAMILVQQEGGKRVKFGLTDAATRHPRFHPP